MGPAAPASLVRGRPAHGLFLAAIAVEGYAVLAVELLAIRQLTPFVGNATDVVAIVIAAVLMPLALGYEAGGRAGIAAGDGDAVRRRLGANLLAATAILGLGLSTPVLHALFAGLDRAGLGHRLAGTALHAALFLAAPVYLLGQTVPLVTRCLGQGDLARLTGRVLFVSTLGSFLGSIVSTLVLMTWLGVHATVMATLGLVLALAARVAWPRHPRQALLAALLAAAVVGLYDPALVRWSHGIVADGPYSQVRIVEPGDGSRLMVVNNSPSSKLAPRPEERFAYVRFIEDEVIARLDPGRAHRILVVGAGGFTIGLRDAVNLYTYLDLDPALQAVAEAHFLGAPLGPNKTFVAEHARAHLRRAPAGAYDLVVLDAYTNRLDIPADLVTREWFAAVCRTLAPGGQVVMNVVASPRFTDRFSRSIDATIRSVFPWVTRQVIRVPGRDDVASILYLAADQPDTGHDVYTDDRNRSGLDR